MPTAHCRHTYEAQTTQEGEKTTTQKLSPFDLSFSLSLSLLEAVPLQSDRCLVFLPPTSLRLSVPRRICSCSGLPFCACVLDLSLFLFFLFLYPLFISFKSRKKKRPSLPPLLKTSPTFRQPPHLRALECESSCTPPLTPPPAGTLSRSVQSLPRRR